MPQGYGFSAKSLGKSLFDCQNDWSGNGLAGQFLLLETVHLTTASLRHLTTASLRHLTTASLRSKRLLASSSRKLGRELKKE